MKTLLATGVALSAMMIAGAASAGDIEDYPSNAVPGHCYQRAPIAAVTESYREHVVDVPEHAATRTIPAVYGEADRQVVVREGRVEHRLVPATYRTVTETEVIRPETVCTEVIPAQYDTVVERIQVSEAHTEWRRQMGPVSDPDMPRRPSERDIICLINVPAEYRRVTRQVLRRPEQVIHTTIPAQTRVRTHQVVDTPAHDVEYNIAPLYSTVHEKVVVQPERTETYTVATTYREVIRTRIVTPAHSEWREVTCRHVEHPRRPRPQSDHGSDGERG